MKIIIKILRSFGTSLLFILLSIIITLQLIVNVINTYPYKLTRALNKENVYSGIMSEEIKDYITRYADYIFYDKSFPSLSLNMQNKDDIETMLSNEKLTYENILLIRHIVSIITNRSINLLINISLFIFYIVLSILKKSFFESLKFFSICLLFAGLLTLITSVFINIQMLKMTSLSLSIIRDVITNVYFANYLKYTLSYIIIGGVLVIITHLIKSTNT